MRLLAVLVVVMSGAANAACASSRAVAPQACALDAHRTKGGTNGGAAAPCNGDAATPIAAAR